MVFISRLVASVSARAQLFAAVAVLAAAPLAQAQITLNANPTANNGGSSGWAIFFDLTATNDIVVTELTTASSATAGSPFTIEVFTFVGSGLGGPVAAGPGSSTAGWTSLGTAAATQGAVSSQISLPVDIPDIAVSAGQTTGVALLFTGAGPRYTTQTVLQTFADANLTWVTGDSRSVPFTPTGSFFSPRGFVGSLTYDLGGSTPVIYCTAGTSTNGCTPSIGATGTPSASASSGFTLTVSGLEGQKQGLFFYGVGGQFIQPWGLGTSFLCVKAPTQRLTTQSSAGTAGLCDGTFAQDWLAFVAANPGTLGAPFSAGNVVNAQAWYRDPPAPKTTNLSDAIEFTLAP